MRRLHHDAESKKEKDVTVCPPIPFLPMRSFVQKRRSSSCFSLCPHVCRWEKVRKKVFPEGDEKLIPRLLCRFNKFRCPSPLPWNKIEFVPLSFPPMHAIFLIEILIYGNCECVWKRVGGCETIRAARKLHTAMRGEGREHDSRMSMILHGPI